MSQSLPVSGFRWLNEEEINKLNISTLSDQSSDGYILEVDLLYPEHLHDLHNDFPLAPETFTVSESMLSPLQKKLAPHFTPTKKLVPNFYPKKNMALHYRVLQFYLAQGLQLQHVHRVLTFKQSAWLAPYIQFNTEQRKVAKTAFEKDFWKLLNNSVFGKTIENLRKRSHIDVITRPSKLLEQLAKPTLDRFIIIDENLALVVRKQRNLKLNRPIYLGFTILDLSKLKILDFHYNRILKLYNPSQCRLLFSDTDSLTYHIECENLWKDLEQIRDELDTSDYAPTHPLFSLENKKVLGKWKDEVCMKCLHKNLFIIWMFIGA